MITTTLNTPGQTQHLRSTTHAYDAEELDALLATPTGNQAHDARSTQVLSAAMLAQTLARDAAARPEGGCDGQASDFTA